MIFRAFLKIVLSWVLGALCLLSPVFANAQQAGATGRWENLPNVPLIPIHNHLLPNGKVMMWGRNGSVGYFWDPISGALASMPNPGYDLFCTGHSHLADGRLLVAGGHVVDGEGLAYSSLYDPVTNTWSRTQDMNAGRWYPTVTTLANGDALVVSGQINNANWGGNPLPQVYQAATNSWRDLTGALLSQWLYPMMFLAPNGKVIEVAPTDMTRYLDTSGAGTWSTVGRRTYGYRDYGSAVMYAPGKILLVGGGDPPTATAEVIDLNVTASHWRAVAPMSFARRQLNTTLLPDGTVLVTGGTSGPGFDNRDTPVYAAELWDPVTETFSTLASASIPRGYHSSTVLLPDGRVLSNGSDDRTEVEIFSPPYLLTGTTRPSMTGVPGSIGYGQRFTVQSPEAGGIAKVTLIRLASVTHAFNMDQRLNALQFTSSSTTTSVDITAPANPNLAPPGNYMLFIVDSTGVPSIGSIVQLGAAAPVGTYQLTVNRSGTAASKGTITSSPAGVSCGSTCAASFAKDTPVTLTAKTTGKSVFTGWTGCDTTSGASCTVTMSGNKTITATFNTRR